MLVIGSAAVIAVASLVYRRWVTQTRVPDPTPSRADMVPPLPDPVPSRADMVPPLPDPVPSLPAADLAAQVPAAVDRPPRPACVPAEPRRARPRTRRSAVAAPNRPRGRG